MILWLILTSGYIGTIIGMTVSGIVYPCFNPSRLSDDVSGEVLAAYKYELEMPPTEWYEPIQLGISKIIHYGYDDPYWVNVVVLNEPFPLKQERPIFKWNDRFYRISSEPGPLPEYSPCPQVQIVRESMIVMGSIVAIGWVLIVYYHLKEKKVNS